MASPLCTPGARHRQQAGQGQGGHSGGRHGTHVLLSPLLLLCMQVPAGKSVLFRGPADAVHLHIHRRQRNHHDQLLNHAG